LRSLSAPAAAAVGASTRSQRAASTAHRARVLSLRSSDLVLERVHRLRVLGAQCGDALRVVRAVDAAPCRALLAQRRLAEAGQQLALLRRVLRRRTEKNR
jgi:hypothetical protein